MKNTPFTLYKSLFVACLGLASCGHLSRPDYVSPGGYSSQGGEYHAQGTVDESPDTAESDQPGDFAPPNEVLDSPNVKKNLVNRSHRGLFHLSPPVAHIKINRGFTTSGRRDHLGLDIAGHKGDRILAAHEGIVIYVGHGFRGYGNMILLEYDHTWATLYGHLSRIHVHTGQEVKAGFIIGEMGRSGRATGVHLHFELIKNKEPIDPAPFLK